MVKMDEKMNRNPCDDSFYDRNDIKNKFIKIYPKEHEGIDNK